MCTRGFEDLRTAERRLAPRPAPSLAPRQGQAMIEFIVGLIAVLALFAGLIQFVSLFIAQTDTFTNARRIAGSRAMAPVAIASGAEYILAWDEADDKRRYSVDDTHSDADPIAFVDTIVKRAARNVADWGQLEKIPRNAVRDLRDSPAPATMFGLMEGRDSQVVPLLPVVRHLLYNRDSIELESSVWMPWCREVY